MGHVTWTTPFQGQFVMYRLVLTMVNLPTKFEVFMFTHSEYECHCKVYKLGVVLGG